MVSHNYDGLVFRQLFGSQRNGREPEVIAAHLVKAREIRVVVVDKRPAFLKKLNDAQGRRLSQVVYVLLVGHTQDENLRFLEAPSTLVKGLSDGFNNMPRHGGVNLTRQFDESSGKLILPGLPGEVEGVDGNAVSSETWAGVERRESERLCLGGFDDFPDVNPHPQGKQLELIDQRDIHTSIGVFED